MWVQQNRNGKFQLMERYTDPLTGKKKTVSVTMERNTTQCKKKAEKALNEKLKTFQCYNSKDLTLEMLVDEYRKDQKLTVKASTYKRNFFACNAIMRMLGNETHVNSLTARYVKQRFLSSGSEPNTLNEHLKRFKSLIRWGYKNDLIKDIDFLDKLELFQGGPSKKERIQDKYLEAEELSTLLNHMDHDTWRLLTAFLALSGLRFGEAAALLTADIDFENRMIHVTKTYDAINDVTTSPKTRCSVRDVYMQQELFNLCKKIKVFMMEQKMEYGYRKSNLFFQNEEGKHIYYYNYNKYLREKSELFLEHAITPHALRHTHASLLLEQGISIDTISRRLGHENSKVTKEIYLHITEKLKEKDNMALAAVKIL